MTANNYFSNNNVWRPYNYAFTQIKQFYDVNKGILNKFLENENFDKEPVIQFTEKFEKFLIENGDLKYNGEIDSDRINKPIKNFTEDEILKTCIFMFDIIKGITVIGNYSRPVPKYKGVTSFYVAVFDYFKNNHNKTEHNKLVENATLIRHNLTGFSPDKYQGLLSGGSTGYIIEYTDINYLKYDAQYIYDIISKGGILDIKTYEYKPPGGYYGSSTHIINGNQIDASELVLNIYKKNEQTTGGKRRLKRKRTKKRKSSKKRKQSKKSRK